jgi:hypothetical protein
MILNIKAGYEKILIFIFFSLAASNLSAQVFDPVAWSFSIKKISQTDSELIFTANIEKGWHLYSQNIPAGGPVATSFKIAKGTGFFLIGNVIEPKSIEVFDKQFNMKINYFSNVAEFRQKVKILSGKPVEMKGTVEFMCCNDETCIPPVEVEFFFTLPASK